MVEWRPKAFEDRSEIFDYIAHDNADAALELDDLIEQRTQALPNQPELYRAGRVRGTREMVLSTNYVLVYRVKQRTGVIEILRIVGARQSYPRRRRRSSERSNPAEV